MRTKGWRVNEHVPAPGCAADIRPGPLLRIPFRIRCKNADLPVKLCRTRHRTFCLLAFCFLFRRPLLTFRYELHPGNVPKSATVTTNPIQPHAKRPPGNRVASSLRENSSNGE